jgi:BirA family transcriptional regulator, biotin operon repressor / biotin---[acetyl-CoA-carboxylase] ligase
MPEPAHPQPRHLAWGAESLWQRLEPLLPGLSVEIVARTDSTSTQLLERARRVSSQDATAAATHGRRAGDAQPCLLVAETQTRGRGRQGKPWFSSPGASLTFSLSLPFTPADWSGLSLAVGLALAEALDPTPAGKPPVIGLKWPNDLLLMDGAAGGHSGGRKLGGILIETVAVGERRMAVIGIGLNVQPQALKDLSLGYACLQELLPDTDAPAVLARIAEPLVRALQDFERAGFAPLRSRFARRDALAGQAVITTQKDLPAGIADGVDPDGALVVQAGGTRHRVTSGEVSVRPAPGTIAGAPSRPAAGTTERTTERSAEGTTEGTTEGTGASTAPETTAEPDAGTHPAGNPVDAATKRPPEDGTC